MFLSKCRSISADTFLSRQACLLLNFFSDAFGNSLPAFLSPPPNAGPDTGRSSSKKVRSVQTIDKISRELRSAVLAGDQVRTGELAAEYVTAFERVWLSLTQSERAVSSLPQQVRELMAWIREVTIIQRSLNAQQLAIVENAIRYQPAGPLQSRSRAVQVRI